MTHFATTGPLLAAPFTWNLVIAWLWIVLGFAAGALLGIGFDRDQWLGGYTSLRRRLYRLGHVAFFGTGFLNLLFVITVVVFGLSGTSVVAAGWSFLAGALSMPVCCALVAHRPTLKPFFALPVLSLLTAGVLVCLEVLQ